MEKNAIDYTVLLYTVNLDISYTVLHSFPPICTTILAIGGKTIDLVELTPLLVVM